MLPRDCHSAEKAGAKPDFRLGSALQSHCPEEFQCSKQGWGAGRGSFESALLFRLVDVPKKIVQEIFLTSQKSQQRQTFLFQDIMASLELSYPLISSFYLDVQIVRIIYGKTDQFISN